MDIRSYEDWKELSITADSNMVEYSIDNSRYGVLIEVAAQHPLKDGVYPDIEFKKRLDLGVRLYNKYKDLGYKVSIYVPGSLHKGDKIALGDAGRNYLVKNKIDIDDILATEVTEELSDGDGVYGSYEECKIASLIFNNRKFKYLHCICSPPQVMRKVLSYIEFGLLPDIHTVDCYSKFHDYIDEIFVNIPYVLVGGEVLEKEVERLREERKVE